MSDAEIAIRAVDDLFMRTVREKKSAELAETLYAEDAELLPPNRPSIIGRLNIAGFWQEMFARGLSNIVLNTTHIDVSGDLAHARGQYAFTFQRDGEVSHEKGKYLLTYRRQKDGLWKVATDYI